MGKITRMWRDGNEIKVHKCQTCNAYSSSELRCLERHIAKRV